jgi:hypothetical protein
MNRFLLTALAATQVFASAIAWAGSDTLLDVQVRNKGQIEYHYALVAQTSSSGETAEWIGLVQANNPEWGWVFQDKVQSVKNLVNGNGGEIHQGVSLYGALDPKAGGAVTLAAGSKVIFNGKLVPTADGFRMCATQSDGTCKTLAGVYLHRKGFFGTDIEPELIY